MNSSELRKIIREEVQRVIREETYALSRQELTKKHPTGVSIQDVYNMISEIEDIDSIQEIGIIISRRDWDNRAQFPVKQKIYQEIQKHIDDKQVIVDLKKLYNQ